MWACLAVGMVVVGAERGADHDGGGACGAGAGG